MKVNTENDNKGQKAELIADILPVHQLLSLDYIKSGISGHCFPCVTLLWDLFFL